MTAALRKPFLSLAVPNYRRYFTGQVVSLSGNWVQIVAETWLILRLTQSGVAVGLLAALQFAPMLVGRLRRAAGRPLRQAQAADDHPAGHGGARAGAVRRDGRRHGGALDGVRLGAGCAGA